MKRSWLFLLLCAACASHPAPDARGPEATRERCSSFASPDVSAAMVERLGHATNLIDYENVWKAEHPGATTGSISGADVRSLIHAKLSEVQGCYAAAISDARDGGGRVVVRSLIDAEGNVTTAHIGESSFGTPEVGCCLVKRVGAWHFPKPSGGFVSVEYPFVVRFSHS